MEKGITILFAYRDRDLERVQISLNSLGKQTSENFKVIFVDYGSNAETAKSAEKLVSSYPFAEYYYVAHPGLLWNKSKAFNFGIRKVLTQFVLTADVDLIFNPETIEHLEKVCSSSAFILFNYGYLPKNIYPDVLKRTAFPQLKPTHFGDVNGVGLYPKKALEQVHGFDEFYHFYGSEDVDLFQRLENAGYDRRREGKNLFLHQWHPRYPQRKEKELTLVPRLRNVLRINQQHYFRCIESDKVIPEKQDQWGTCISREESKVLATPTHVYGILNLEAAVFHILNEQLSSCEGAIVAIHFFEDGDYSSLRTGIKKVLGRSVQKYLSMKEVNDEVLKQIIFHYRDYNYSYRISENLKQISFIVDLRGDEN